jgi:hypothetical protein
VRPGLATTHGPLILFTTPHARSGEVWKICETHYGEKGDPSILVVRGTSRDFNPTLSERVVARALARDPEAARAEYLAEFRSDVSALLAEAALASCVVEGLREVAPRAASNGELPEVRAHFDAATGSGSDAAALGIAFVGKSGEAELAAVRRWRPPFSPAQAVREAAALCATYGAHQLTVDRYAPGLVIEMFREHGIVASVAESNTSESFIALLSLINSQRVALLDVPELLGELRRLERRPGAAGGEFVGHPPGGHDDVAAATAQALVAASSSDSGPTVRILRTQFREEEVRSSRGGLEAARQRCDAQVLAAFRGSQVRF